MPKTTSIRWHSRAGQGAITVANALAQILGEQGRQVQSFPEFGAEKRGAPVMVFNRIADTPITTVAKPTELDIVILLDTTLVASGELSATEVLAGLRTAGSLLINTTQQKVKFAEGQSIFTIDASEISLTEIGKNIPNVPILGALLQITALAELKSFLPALEEYLTHSLPAPIVAGNLKAFERGYNEVKKI